MSRLGDIISTTGIIVGTGLATYGGIELGEKLGNYLPQRYMLPQIAQGFTAFFTGTVGNQILRSITRKRSISESEAYSIAALNAFANATNESRNLTPKTSLEQISNNLVEVIVNTDNRKISGSGLMITTDGYVITAHHVIKEMIENHGTAKVRTRRGVVYPVPGESIWYNKNTDIAVIKARRPCAHSEPIKVKVDRDSKLKTGEEVRVFGFLNGQEYNTLGVVTNPSYEWTQEGGNVVYDLFQTDVRTKEGQSGGIVANGNGELIGIVVYSLKHSGEEIGVLGGAKISNALAYINQIAAKKSAKMFV